MASTFSHLLSLTVSLLASILLAQPAAACADSGTNIYVVATNAGNQVGQTASQYLDSQQKLAGLAASACNAAQRDYFFLEANYNSALQLDAMCKETYYDNIHTLSDVSPWLTCEEMALTVLFDTLGVQRAFETIHATKLNEPCTFCSDTVFGPVDPRLDQALASVAVLMDWTNKLINIQTRALQEGGESLLRGAMIAGVKEGGFALVSNITSSVITKGFQPPPLSPSRRHVDTNTTEEFQLISSPTEIKISMQMVPGNGYTMADLEAGIRQIIYGANFTSQLATDLNGNVTGFAFETFRMSSNTASSSGSALAASPSATASSAASSAASWGARSKVLSGGFSVLLAAWYA